MTNQGITSHETRKEAISCLYKKAASDPMGFWDSQAERLCWFEKWKTTCDFEPPFARWFNGGKINASFNCVDRHVNEGRGAKTAIYWEGERGECRTLSFQDLLDEVCRMSECLIKLGLKKGDRIALYMPMIPEAIVAMLASSRIGAIHTVVFAGFSSQALKDRIEDSKAKLLITADGGFRKGKIVPLKQIVDEAVSETPSIEHVLVIAHTKEPVNMQSGRDHYYHDLKTESSCLTHAELMDASDPLFILYTSGTTGKPKGILHSTGGYLVGVHSTMHSVFDIQDHDVFWCTADIGWITGHSYVVYGPLSAGASIVMYEGVPDFPQKNRFWKIIEKYKVSIFYTAPTAIRMFMKWTESWLEGCDLSSLRLLGSVGEPINPEAWQWYHRHIGSSVCPVIDTWWQTETGSIMIAPTFGYSQTKPGSASRALPGIDADIFNEQGLSAKQGYLVIKKPWPSMLLGIYNDQKRFVETYLSKWDHYAYLTGDGASLDDQGCFWLEGRVDDVINVSGHRLGSAEIESAMIDYEGVAESAAIGINHDIKGQAIACFVTMKENHRHREDLESLLKAHIDQKIGAIARPEKIFFVDELPKTRSGKIMRRLLRDLAEGRELGDTTSLSDQKTISQIKEQL